LPLPHAISPTTFLHPSQEINDEYGAPGMRILNPAQRITDLKPVSILFGHWETKAVRELVLTNISSSATEEYDLQGWDKESSHSNASGACDFHWASPRVVEKVDNWLSTVIDTPQVVNNIGSSNGSV
jgi:hypothetical protein